MIKDDVIKAIKTLHSEAPSNIETEAICKDNPELLSAAIDEFGSLGEAVRASGLEFFFEFEFNGLRLRSGRVEVARALLDWTEHHGPISSIALKKTAPELLQITNKLFGSLTRISTRLGLPLMDGEEVDVPIPGSQPKEDAPQEAAPKQKEPKDEPKDEPKQEEPKVIEVERPPVEEEPEQELYPIEPEVEGGDVECKVCGKTFKRLGLHLSRTHGLGIDEYQRGDW